MVEKEPLKLRFMGSIPIQRTKFKETIMRTIMVLLFLVGCSNKYDECIEQQKKEYRERNPKASYGLIQSRQQDFELMCSKFKGK